MIKFTPLGRDVLVEIDGQNPFSIDKQKPDFFILDATHISFTVGGGGSIPLSEIELDGTTPSDLDEFKSLWSTVFPNPEGAGSTTLYSGNGTLAGNRVVTLDGKSIDFKQGLITRFGIFAGNSSIKSPDGNTSLRIDNGVVQMEGLPEAADMDDYHVMVWNQLSGESRHIAVNDMGIGGGITNITYANLLTAISGSTLTAGATYKITDRGDSGLYFQAISTNQLSKTGLRNMLCPSFYGTGASGGKTWIGVWNETKNPNIGDLTIWGGLVWESLTGNIGTADSDIALDAVNWVVVDKSSFSNSEYVEKLFGVSYDVTNDWIERQWDGKGNVFGIDFATEQIELKGFNMCDISDWNFSSGGGQFYNNKATGCFNNSCTNIISNTVFRVISNNRNTSSIVDNWVGGEITDNSNTGIIQDNFIMINIEENSNSGAIRYNRCENLEGNSNGGHIERNVMSGHIEENSNVGIISWNMNNGHIESCDSGEDPCDIHHNINNGDISGTFAADVLDTIVNKS